MRSTSDWEVQGALLLPDSATGATSSMHAGRREPWRVRRPISAPGEALYRSTTRPTGVSPGPPGCQGANQFDFLTVATHELGHVLGIGTAASWFTYVDASNNTFLGPHADASYGGPVPLDASAGDDAADGHWADGTLSHGQVTTMNPTIVPGIRRLFTSLDWAGLDDIGWQTDQLAVTASRPPMSWRASDSGSRSRR